MLNVKNVFGKETLATYFKSSVISFCEKISDHVKSYYKKVYLNYCFCNGFNGIFALKKYEQPEFSFWIYEEYMSKFENLKFDFTHASSIRFVNKTILNSDDIKTRRILNTKLEIKNTDILFLNQPNNSTNNSAAACWNSCKKDKNCAASSFAYLSLKSNLTCRKFGKNQFKIVQETGWITYIKTT